MKKWPEDPNFAQVRPTRPKGIGQKIQVKNSARSSVLRNINPRNRLPLQTTQRSSSSPPVEYLPLPVAGQHQFSVALNRRHLIPVVPATGLIGHLAVEILLNLSHRDVSVTIAVTSPVGSAIECC